jgi:hypothetical protein
MLAGAPPFYSRDKNVMFKNRIEKPVEMKPWFSAVASSLLQGLLNIEVQVIILDYEIAELKAW